MVLSQGTISTAARLPVRAVVLLIVPLRKSIVAKCSQYRESTIILLAVSVGIVARNPFACANLARTLRKIQDIWKPSRVKITGNNYLNGLLPFKIHGIHSKSCLLDNTKQTMKQGSNGTRHPSRLVPLCCVTLFVVYSFIYNMFQLSTWFRACAKLPRRWACTKLVKSLRACDAIQFLKEYIPPNTKINCRQFWTWLQ